MKFESACNERLVCVQEGRTCSLPHLLIDLTDLITSHILFSVKVGYVRQLATRPCIVLSVAAAEQSQSVGTMPVDVVLLQSHSVGTMPADVVLPSLSEMPSFIICAFSFCPFLSHLLSSLFCSCFYLFQTFIVFLFNILYLFLPLSLFS